MKKLLRIDPLHIQRLHSTGFLIDILKNKLIKERKSSQLEPAYKMTKELREEILGIIRDISDNNMYTHLVEFYQDFFNYIILSSEFCELEYIKVNQNFLNDVIYSILKMF